jgi:hypothetical protein
MRAGSIGRAGVLVAVLALAAGATACGVEETVQDASETGTMEFTVPAIVVPPPDSGVPADTLPGDSLLARDTARVP